MITTCILLLGEYGVFAGKITLYLIGLCPLLNTHLTSGTVSDFDIQKLIIGTLLFVLTPDERTQLFGIKFTTLLNEIMADKNDKDFDSDMHTLCDAQAKLELSPKATDLQADEKDLKIIWDALCDDQNNTIYMQHFTQFRFFQKLHARLGLIQLIKSDFLSEDKAYQKALHKCTAMHQQVIRMITPAE